MCSISIFIISGIPPIVANVQKYHLEGMLNSFCVWDPMVQSVSCQLGWDDVINNFAINLFGWALVNIITSSITIIKLHSRRTKVHGRKSIITIVLLSISSCFMYAPAPIGALMLAKFEDYNEFASGRKPEYLIREPSYEITFFLIITYLPQITSVLNPIILIVRGSRLRKFIMSRISGAAKIPMTRQLTMESPVSRKRCGVVSNADL